MQIRDETAADREAIHRLNASAFDTPAEARLVDRLRADGEVAVSLVAVLADAVVGQILFSGVSLGADAGVKIVGLAPMAVAAEYRRRGIGSALVEAGLQRCSDTGYDAVVVLGEPSFYSRFGFRPAGEFGLGSEYDVAAEYFMAVDLRPESLREAGGVVRYAPAFADL